MSLFIETHNRATKAEAELIAAYKDIARLERELKSALNELDTRRMELVNVKRQMRSLPPAPPMPSRPQYIQPVRLPNKLVREDFFLADDEVEELFKAKAYYDGQDKVAKAPGRSRLLAPIAALFRAKL